MEKHETGPSSISAAGFNIKWLILWNLLADSLSEQKQAHPPGPQEPLT
jgi:hypothetical protein